MEMIDDARLRPVEAAYVHVLRINWALFLGPLLIGALAADLFWLAPETRFGGWASGIVGALLLFAVLITAPRQFTHLAYALGSDHLRSLRGFLFHTDTVVPFVRVQHIDVGQGPVERLFGLAHVVVHTAGTHNSIVTLPGLTRADADAMRETIRRQIVTDFA